jgi:DNA transposition AAA+ family ATPase
MQPSVPSVITAPANTGGISIAAHEFESTIATAYEPAQQEILRFWFFAARERNWSLGRLAQLTGVSTTVLSRIFRGIYPTDGAAIIDKLRKARETFHESADNPDFIETSLSKRMFAVFDKTRALRTVAILWGQMGIGKTECIMEYQRRNNHGRTQVVRFPAGATFAFFVSHLARSCGVATRSQSAFEQRGKILQVLSAGQRLLIIDELHQAFLTTRTDTAIKCCEFLREIADTASCGLALVGTELLEHAFFRGQHRDALRQLVDRGTVQVGLPAKATQADYRKFLASYGLDLPPASEPEATAILSDIIKSAGLRKLTLHLRDGAAYAGKREEVYQWHHFVAAFEAIQTLSK